MSISIMDLWMNHYSLGYEGGGGVEEGLFRGANVNELT